MVNKANLFERIQSVEKHYLCGINIANKPNIMKRRLILISVFAILLAACTGRLSYNRVLVQADSLVQSRPDSALWVLENLPVDSLKTKADRAYYALLITKARDKNYIIQKDDSLIQTAVRYYDSTEETEMQAQAYYYWGGIYRDRNEQAKAIEKYLWAAPLAQEAGDKVLLGRIYANAGYIYYLQKFYDKADSIYHQTEQIGVILQDTSLWAESVAIQGKIKLYQNRYSTAEEKLLEALSILGDFKQNGIRGNIVSALSSLYNWTGDGKKALKYAKQNLYLQKDTIHCYRAFLVLGDAYHKLGQYDSSYIYISKCLSSPSYGTKASAYMRLADIDPKRSSMNNSLAMERLYSAYKDSLFQTSQSNDIIKAEQRIQLYKQQSLYENFLRTYRYYIIILVAICSLALYLFQIYHNKTLERHRIHQQKIEEELRIKDICQQDLLRQKDNEIKALQQQITQQMYDNKQQSRIAELHKLQKQRIGLIKEIISLTDINSKINQILSDYKEKGRSKECLSKNEWARLMAEIDKDGIIQRIRYKYQFTDEEYYLCCLQLTNYSVTEMGHLLRCERTTVYRKEQKIVKTMGISYKAGELKKIINSLIGGEEIGI